MSTVLSFIKTAILFFFVILSFKTCICYASLGLELLFEKGKKGFLKRAVFVYSIIIGFLGASFIFLGSDLLKIPEHEVLGDLEKIIILLLSFAFPCLIRGKDMKVMNRTNSYVTFMALAISAVIRSINF